VRQVGHLQELYRNAQSTKHKKELLIFFVSGIWWFEFLATASVYSCYRCM